MTLSQQPSRDFVPLLHKKRTKNYLHQLLKLLFTMSGWETCVSCNSSSAELELHENFYPEPYSNHRQLLRYEKNGLESTFDTKKKHILKNN
jgi:hypothetical protein